MAVEFRQEVEKGGGVLLVKVGGGFVQQDELRFGGERLRDEHTLPLTTGKFCKWRIHKGFKLDIVDSLHGDFAIVFSIATEEMAFNAAHEDDVEDGCGEGRVELDGLGDVSDFASGPLWFMAEHADITMFRCKETENQLQKGGLAAAVRTDHYGEHAFRDVEVDVMEDFACIV